MRTSRAISATTLLTLTATLAAVPSQSSAEQRAGEPRRAAAAERYVALGDSYASGSGAGDYTDVRCTRSANAYPALWAGANSPAAFTFVACGGAEIPDVLREQVSSLGSDTTLVSLSIGGNDAGFAETMLTCSLSTDAACERALARAGQFVRNELPAQLDNLYDTVRSRAPKAKVVIVGYPYLYKEGGTCLGGLSARKRAAINDGSDLLNETISGRASKAGFAFADARPAFKGHEICTDDPWISRSNIHPTAEGHASGYLPSFSASVSNTARIPSLTLPLAGTVSVAPGRRPRTGPR